MLPHTSKAAPALACPYPSTNLVDRKRNTVSGEDRLSQPSFPATPTTVFEEKRNHQRELVR
jgi:hypothetical protein